MIFANNERPTMTFSIYCVFQRQEQLAELSSKKVDEKTFREEAIKGHLEAIEKHQEAIKTMKK